MYPLCLKTKIIMESEGNRWPCKVVTVAVKKTFTRSKSTIETLEKGLKCVSDIFLVLLLLTWNIFHIFFSVSIVSFERACNIVKLGE